VNSGVESEFRALEEIQFDIARVEGFIFLSTKCECDVILEVAGIIEECKC
jgi:hypothetical protein